MFGAGDYLAVAYSYTVGATQFATSGNAGQRLIWNGQSVAFGFTEDGVYGGTATTGLNSIELTTAWSVAAGYEHFWTPALQTSLYGSYAKVSHNANAISLICASGGVYTATCNPDWSGWNLGSRTQWNVVKGLYVGLDVIYSKLKTAQSNNAGTITLAGTLNGAKAAGTYNVADQSAWNFAFRVHRDIVP
jgi:hypothetical protein